MSKKSKKTTSKSTEKRPAKRKKIISLAQYEAERKGAELAPAGEPKDDIAATVDAVESGNLAEGVTAPAGKKRKHKTDAPATERKPSGLDAAVRVLREAGTPLNCGEMVKTMLEKGYWSTGGKTPSATIYAAILRECATKGEKSRFRKTDRGHFELTDAGKEA